MKLYISGAYLMCVHPNGRISVVIRMDEADLWKLYGGHEE